MGKTSSRGPNTNKNEENGSCRYLKYGLCEMQGWRSRMEDASIATMEFDENTSLFGVMDGHGGSLVSNFVASNFVGLLKHMKSYKQRKYEQALIETFLKFDELLRIEKVDNFLKQNANTTKKEGRLDVKFAKSEQKLDVKEQKECNDDVNLCNTVKSKFSKTFKIRSEICENQRIKNNLENSEYSLRAKSVIFPNQIDKEDLIFKDNLNENINYNSCLDSKSKSNSHFNSNENSPKSMKTSEDSKSNDSLNFYTSKLQISRKKDSSDCVITQNYDTLIARDMGTTANILLIKNSQIFIANVGDSMAVLFKNGQAIRLNEEHKVTLASEFARINKSGAKIINNRIEGRLNLTRAIGNIDLINIYLPGDMCFKKNSNLKFYEQSVTAYPQITNQKITKDCEFIIMGCDGVWDCVDAQKLCEFVSQKLKTKMKISSIISEIFDKIISKTNNSKFYI